MSEVVPEGWSIKSIGSIFERISNGTTANQIEAEEGVAVTRIETISDGVINFSKVGRINSLDADERYLMKRGDILFSNINSVKHIGKVAFYNGEKKLFHGMNLLLFRADEETAHKKFLFNLMRSDDFICEISKKVKPAINQASISGSDLKEIEFLSPPLPEQKKIASILTSVDEVIENTQSQIDKLQDLKKATMNELLTKGIGHTEFKDSELGRIPKSWEVAPVAEVSDFVTSGSRGWSQYYSERGAIFIRIGNLTRDNINLDFEDTVRVTPPVNGEGVRTKVSLGDILISITADLGVIGVVHEGVGEAYVNQHVCLVRLKENSPVIARWAGHYLSGEVCQHQFRIKNDGGAKAGLNLPTIRSIKVAQPSIIEQDKICEMLDHFDTQIRKNRIKLQQTQSLKKSLMQDLLTGKVRVSVN